MSRPARLQAAKRWIAEYRGGDLVRGYRKWFGVTELCSVLEPRMLGVDIPDARLEQARHAERARAARRAARRESGARAAAFPAWYDDLEPVAGWPAGGEPDPAGWGDAEAAWEQTLDRQRVVEAAGGVDRLFDDEDLPF